MIETIVVNAFGGPGAGKTTAAWEMAAELKKRGLCVEYVSEYAKDLVWEEEFDLLDGSLENQKILLKEQKRRIDRLIGKVDIVITDSPILLNLTYCKNCPNEYENEVLRIFNAYNNFNFVIKRGRTFEQRGRIHDLKESMQKDEEIVKFLKVHKIFYGTYDHSKIELLTENILTSFGKLSTSRENNKNNKIVKKAKHNIR